MVRGHLEELRTRLGDARYGELVKQLSPADQDDLRLVTPLSWIQVATLERLYAVVAPALQGRSVPAASLLRRLANKSTSGSWSVQCFLAKSATSWAALGLCPPSTHSSLPLGSMANNGPPWSCCSLAGQWAQPIAAPNAGAGIAISDWCRSIATARAPFNA